MGNRTVAESPLVTIGVVQKAFNSLIGIVEGIVIDAAVNDREIDVLRQWVGTYQEFRGHQPFAELLPLLEQVLFERRLTEDERQDILWLCEKLSSADYLDRAQRDLQRLQALLAGIIADDVVSAEELAGLSGWMAEHEHLRRHWPYEEVSAIISRTMVDHRVDPEELESLKQFFSLFVPQRG
jgi:hypothetical protein